MVRYRHTHIDNPEALYFITYVTKNRHPYFKNLKDMRKQWLIWKEVLDNCDGSLFAFIFLRDHSHIVMKQGNQNYSRSVKFFKQNMNSLFVGKRGTMWQSRFWEHFIRNDEDLIRHVDYIHYNPVKHEYVSKPLNYLYTSLKRFLKRGHYSVEWGEVINIKCSGEPE